jgi:hypothetical protein
MKTLSSPARGLPSTAHAIASGRKGRKMWLITSASIRPRKGMFVRVSAHASRIVTGITTTIRAMASPSDVAAASHADGSVQA